MVLSVVEGSNGAYVVAMDTDLARGCTACATCAVDLDIEAANLELGSGRLLLMGSLASDLPV